MRDEPHLSSCVCSKMLEPARPRRGRCGEALDVARETGVKQVPSAVDDPRLGANAADKTEVHRVEQLLVHDPTRSVRGALAERGVVTLAQAGDGFLVHRERGERDAGLKEGINRAHLARAVRFRMGVDDPFGERRPNPRHTDDEHRPLVLVGGGRHRLEPRRGKRAM